MNEYEDGIVVLSLFDGKSCGQIALERAGIKVKQYYSSEIDKYAKRVAKINYPNTIFLGDVTKVFAKDLPKIDIVIGGSPCQGFSFAGKRLNFKDPRSLLFFEFVRLVEECKPRFFLLENVQMKKEHENVISKYLNVSPIELNSNLFSAQNRSRNYWTNIGMQPMGLFGYLESIIPQPKDKGILLAHILEEDVPDKYFLSEKMLNWLCKHSDKNKSKGHGFNFSPKENMHTKSVTVTNEGKGRTESNYIVDLNRKSRCFTAGGNSGGLHSDMEIIVHNTLPRSSTTGKGGSGPLSRSDGKTYSLLASKKVNAIEFNGKYIRRLTPLECERLQTLPDNYTAYVSDTQRYKMIGNGWTIDVIAYIFSFLKTDLFNLNKYNHGTIFNRSTNCSNLFIYNTVKKS